MLAVMCFSTPWIDHHVFQALIFNAKTQSMNSNEVQNPRNKLGVFGSVLASAKSDHVFQKLSYSLCGLCLSLSSL